MSVHTIRSGIGSLLFAFAVFLAVLSIRPAETQAAGLAEIESQGYFSYGLGGAYRPFGYRDENNELVGFDVDLANEIGKRLGVEARPVESAWATIIQSLKLGMFDVIIGGMTATAERYEQVNFSTPYMEASSGILVLDADNVAELKDLDGRTVGAATGTPQLEQLEISATDLGIAYAGPVETYAEDALAFEAMRAGRLQGYASSLVSLADFAATTEGFSVIRLVSDKWPSEWTAAAFRKEDEDFREAFNKAMADMRADGTLAALHEKWFGASYVDALPEAAPTF